MSAIVVLVLTTVLVAVIHVVHKTTGPDRHRVCGAAAATVVARR